MPVTYMNSSADIKAFCGKHDGVVCTSSNAKSVLEWALERGEKVLFLPDQHLRPQHRGTADGHEPRRLRGLRPAAVQRRPHGRRAASSHDDLVEGSLLGARTVHPDKPSTTSAHGCPVSVCWFIPSASTRWC